jgi:hypothetical protein
MKKRKVRFTYHRPTNNISIDSGQTSHFIYIFMLLPDCTCTKYGQRMSKNIQLHLWAVLSLAATGYPVRNVLLLVADDAGLEVS